MRLVIVLGVALLSGACGSIKQDEPGLRNDDVDHDRMAIIEEQASHSGARVHWVNPPRKPAAASSN